VLSNKVPLSAKLPTMAMRSLRTVQHSLRIARSHIEIEGPCKWKNTKMSYSCLFNFMQQTRDSARMCDVMAVMKYTTCY